MSAFKTLFLSNLKRRTFDGFAIGYNVIFPILMTWLLGFLCKGLFADEMVTGYQYFATLSVHFLCCCFAWNLFRIGNEGLYETEKCD